MTSVRQRFSLLVTIAIIAVFATACGRATEDQINQALGITPTATHSTEMASLSGTATGAGTAQSGGAASAVALGDVTKGKRQFGTWCAGCHGPGGAGPDIRAPGSAGSTVTAESLLPLIRNGTGHPTPPGPYKTTEISDSQIVDIAAYLRSEAAS